VATKTSKASENENKEIIQGKAHTHSAAEAGGPQDSRHPLAHNRSSNSFSIQKTIHLGEDKMRI